MDCSRSTTSRHWKSRTLDMHLVAHRWIKKPVPSSMPTRISGIFSTLGFPCCSSWHFEATTKKQWRHTVLVVVFGSIWWKHVPKKHLKTHCPKGDVNDTTQSWIKRSANHTGTERSMCSAQEVAQRPVDKLKARPAASTTSFLRQLW